MSREVIIEFVGWFTWVVLPSIIFLTRVLDVTLGTMRIIFISRGRKYLAPLLGFVEVLIWITVVSQIVGGARNFVAYLAYAAGFAVGNYVGMAIESKLAIGTLVVRVILSGGEEARGYTPNRAARQLRRQKAETIGYILPAGAQHT